MLDHLDESQTVETIWRLFKQIFNALENRNIFGHLTYFIVVPVSKIPIQASVMVEILYRPTFPL